MVVPRDESEVVLERACPGCGALASGAAGQEGARCAACLRRPGRLRDLVATTRPCSAPAAMGIPDTAAGGCDTPLHPYRRDGEWEYAACALDDVSARIDALARRGWECTFVSTPHHGSLTLIGYFRRRVTPTAGPQSGLAAPERGR